MTVTRFEVPPDRWADRPPEQRGVARDRVRLLVVRPDGITHARFEDLPRFLDPGDVLVVNTSATRPAAIDAVGFDGPVTVHLSAPRGDGRWVIELRLDGGRTPLLDARPGDAVRLRGGGTAVLEDPVAAGPRGTRLWAATVAVPGGDVSRHLADHGRPISYTLGRAPLTDHQTVFATHPGSAEMASAGRPFSDRLVTRLVSGGVLVVPVSLHAGVSSQEAGEAPQPEWRDVPAATAHVVNDAVARGSRVVAVGTTATRALESAVEQGGRVRPVTGPTDLVVTPEQGVRVVAGLVTGWHEADASHLMLLEAVAGAALVGRAYEAALAGPYLWHEFGDSCLLLP